MTDSDRFGKLSANLPASQYCRTLSPWPVSVPTLRSMGVIYQFVLDQPRAYGVSNRPPLELRSGGSSNQFIALRQQI